MIYVDSSVLLAQLLSEDHCPPPAFWNEQLIASRLAEYEVWNRINARNLSESHGDATRQILARVSMVELSPVVLRRALDPFPEPLRTLDALHLASIAYLRSQRLHVTLASYDERMTRVAAAMSIPLEPLASGLGRSATPAPDFAPGGSAAPPEDWEANE